MNIQEQIHELLVNKVDYLLTSNCLEVHIPFCTYNLAIDYLRILNIHPDLKTFVENSQDWSVTDLTGTYAIGGNKWNGGVIITKIKEYNE